MFANFITAVGNTVVSWARACGNGVKRSVEPARSAATATARVARDSVRRRTELLADNDGKYGPKFAAVAEGAGIDVVSIPPKSPNLTPICERFLGSVRRECLDHIVILGEDHLRRVLKQYVHVYFNVHAPSFQPD